MAPSFAPYQAGLQLFGNAHHPGQIARVEIRGKAKGRGIGDLNDLRLRYGSETAERPARRSLRRRRPWLHPHRPKQWAQRKSGRGRAACRRSERARLVPTAFAMWRSTFSIALALISGPISASPPALPTRSAETACRSFCAKELVDRVCDVNTVRANAGLPRVAELGYDQAAYRSIEIRIVKDDKRRHCRRARATAA